MGRTLLKLSICYKQNLYFLCCILRLSWACLLILIMTNTSQSLFVKSLFVCFLFSFFVFVFPYKLMWLGTNRAGWWLQRPWLTVVLWAREELEMWSLSIRHPTGEQGFTALVTVAVILRGLSSPCTGVQVATIAASPRWWHPKASEAGSFRCWDCTAFISLNPGTVPTWQWLCHQCVL